MAQDMSSDFLSASPGGYEPQRQNNWMLTIDGLGDGTIVLQRSLQSVDFPEETSSTVEIDHLNEKKFFAGKVEFNAPSMSLKDFVDSKTAATMIAWRRTVYDATTGGVGYASDYKRTGWLALLSPDGQQERVWEIQGLWPESVNYGSGDMSTSDVNQIEVTLRCDKALPYSGF